MAVSDELACQELVELVTDYLANVLPHDQRMRFEQHLEQCDGCRSYLEQMRITIRLTGNLRDENLAPEVREELLNLFRNWKLAKQ
jgi:hypothetical protein